MCQDGRGAEDAVFVQIPDFNGSVSTAGGDAAAVEVELDVVYEVCVEGGDYLGVACGHGCMFVCVCLGTV